MIMHNSSKYAVFRWVFIITSLFLVISIFQTAYNPLRQIYGKWVNTGEWFTPYSIQIITMSLRSIIILSVLALVMAILALMKPLDHLIDKGIAFYKCYWQNSGWLSWGGVIFSTLGFSFTALLLPTIVQSFLIRLFLFEVAVFICAISLKALLPQRNWGTVLVGSILLIAVIYRIMVFVPQVSTSPFSLGWSEGTRYYNASLFFAERIYGQAVPPCPWHASRYMLLAVPWLIPGIPLWFHRLWQVLLWIGTSGASSFLLAKRLKLQDWFRVGAFSAWMFLYLFHGPVYYHLLICVILVLWGLDHEKPVQSFVVIILASIWAGLSRVNWIPVPVFIAITLYFLETPWIREITFLEYMKKPVFWGIGGITAAFLSYLGYALLSGNELSKFKSSFTSDLLWYRLLPNATYRPGILLGIIVVTFPLLAIIIMWLRNINHTKRSSIKLLGLGLILLILFAGGLVVSVKIGGGGNLHNMDAYLTILLVATSYIFWNRTAKDLGTLKIAPSNNISRIITMLAIAVPVCATLTTGGHFSIRDKVVESNDLASLQEIVKEAASQGGEVLFMSERHLQTFGLISDVAFAPEYEKVEVMEMAKAGNTEYLKQFYRDIENQRFSIIISDPIHTHLKGHSKSFSEENNVWVERVARIVLEYYQASQLGKQSDIYILTPKP